MPEPRAGESFWNDEGEDTEIAEVQGPEDEGGERFRVTDEDGEDAVIIWSKANERWEVDA